MKDKELYKVRTGLLECELKEKEGYFCSDGHQFIIEANLVLGHVKNQKNEFIQNIKVNLQSQDGATISSEVTDDEGRYYFEGVYPGAYTLIPQVENASAESTQRFVPETQEFSVVIGEVAKLNDFQIVESGITGYVYGLK